jgi:hypothetical protein
METFLFSFPFFTSKTTHDREEGSQGNKKNAPRVGPRYRREEGVAAWEKNRGSGGEEKRNKGGGYVR